MQRFMGAIYLSAAFALAGTSVVAGRLVTGVLGSFTITMVSLFFALLALLPLCGRQLLIAAPGMRVRDWLPLLLQALCGIFLFRLLLLEGLLYTSTGEAGILTGVTPAATALLAKIWLREPLYPARLLGVVSTVAGIMLIQGIALFGQGFSSAHFLGNLLVMGAALCESIFNVLSRIAGRNQGPDFDPLMQTTLVTAIALLLCLAPALGERPLPALMSLGVVKWLALAWYGLFVTALAFIFWYAGIQRCDASVAAAFSGMMPLTALVLSVVLLKEQPGWIQGLGGMMVVAGMLLAGRQPPALPGHRQSPI